MVNGSQDQSSLHAFKETLKQIRVPILSGWIRSYFSWRYGRAELAKYRNWMALGRPDPPPPLYKQIVVRSAATRFGIRILIETGTFEGQMVDALRRDFDRIYTVELDPTLSAQARERFRNYSHISVLQGDSSLLLAGLLAQVHEPAIFWLDAHYSGGPTARGDVETPIMAELSAIAAHERHRDHVILIDDAREFCGGPYPAMTEIERYARTGGYDTMEIEGDIIRIYNARGRGVMADDRPSPVGSVP